MVNGSINNFNLDKVVVVSYVIEGDQDDIGKQFNIINETAGKFNGYLIGDYENLNLKVLEKFWMYLRVSLKLL